MAGEINGADVTVYVNTGTPGSPIWTLVGSQRNVTFQNRTGIIDRSSKESADRRILGGRREYSVTLDALFIPGATALAALRTAQRTGALAQLRRVYAGSPVEKADAIVADMPETFPDQDAATVSVTFEIDGAWGAP